jgi:DNA-binding response OmpR family regulator
MLRGAGDRILVIEDQAPVRRLIALWLRRHGFVVLPSSDATKALALLRRHPHSITLAIIDVVGTRGLDVGAEMERDHRHTPILYISGHVDSLAVQAIAWRSPDQLLLKPFNERILMDRVRRLISRAAPGTGSDFSSETALEPA